MELEHYGHHSKKAITYPGQRIGVSAWDFLHHGHHGMQLPGFNSHSFHSVYCSDSENTISNEKLAYLEKSLINFFLLGKHKCQRCVSLSNKAEFFLSKRQSPMIWNPYSSA
jgi:hypothetical protein